MNFSILTEREQYLLVVAAIISLMDGGMIDALHLQCGDDLQALDALREKLEVLNPVAHLDAAAAAEQAIDGSYDDEPEQAASPYAYADHPARFLKSLDRVIADRPITEVMLGNSDEDAIDANAVAIREGAAGYVAEWMDIQEAKETGCYPLVVLIKWDERQADSPEWWVNPDWLEPEDDGRKA